MPEEVYASQVGLAEMALDTDAIGEVIQQIRARIHASD